MNHEKLTELVESARLRFPTCRDCGDALVANEEADNLMCYQCGRRHCPFCGCEVPWSPDDEGCPHFVVTTGTVDWEGWDPDLALPSFEDCRPPDEWESELVLALGDLAFLTAELEEYATGETNWTRSTENALREGILHHMTDSVVSLWWGGLGMASATGADHFALDGKEALDRLWHDWDRVERAITSFAARHHPGRTI